MAPLQKSKMIAENTSMSKIFILFIVLFCLTGQTLATSFSCKKVQQLNSTTSSKMNCHEAMETSHTSSNMLLDEIDEGSSDCEEKCSCCITVCASTSLFLSSLSVQSPIDTVVPYLSQAEYSAQATSLYRPPIV